MIPSFTPPVWLKNGHAQTLYANLFVTTKPLPWQREAWKTPDQDTLWIDSLSPANPVAQIIILHGLEGSSQSKYVQQLANYFYHANWRVIAPNFRGCAEPFNTQPRLYHAGDSSEIEWLVQTTKKLSPIPIFITGISLGANMMLQWLGDSKFLGTSHVSAVVAIACPFDLTRVGDHLARGINKLYTAYFLKTLKIKAQKKAQQFPQLFDLPRALHATTLRTFDDAVIAPLHGFKNVDDYWQRASCLPNLQKIRCPTLLINSEDDPFLPHGLLPSGTALSTSIQCCYTKNGGHIGYIQSPFLRNQNWLVQRIADFLEPQIPT